MSNDKSIEFPTIKNRDENGDVDMEVLNETIEYIRPAVQADGGDIKLASVNDGVVNILDKIGRASCREFCWIKYQVL